MKRLLPFLLLATLIAEYTLILSTAQALPDHFWKHPYIHIYDENGNERSEFAVGERIRIVTYFPSPLYWVKVIDPDGQVKYRKLVWSPKTKEFDSGLLDNITDTIGPWEVEAGILFWYKVGTYHVIPVAPLGILGTLAACFTGLGIKSFKTRHHAR